MKYAILVKKALFTVLILMLATPLFQSSFKIIQEQELYGSFTPSPHQTFSISDWLSGEFQEIEALYLNENFGFRKSFVRLYNQMNYSFWRETSAKEVLVGKYDYLLGTIEINSYLGLDFMGPELITHKIEKLAFLRDTLATYGTDLIFLFAPGKASYFPEYIPDSYPSYSGAVTNYDFIKEECAMHNLDFFDVHKWIVDSKDTAAFPAFSKTGIHINEYTDMLIVDSLLKRLEMSLNIRLADIAFDSLIVSDEMKYPDDDIERSMNLLFNIEDEPMPYMTFSYLTDSMNNKPNVLTVGDSFYWQLYESGLSSDVYNSNSFWYYLNDIYPKKQGASNSLYDYDIAEELIKHDVVVFWITERNAPGLGFIERAYDSFFNPNLTDYEIAVRKQIIAIERSPEWFQLMISNAKRDGKSVEEVVHSNAKYMVSIQ